MNQPIHLTPQQFAELLAGIVRSQQAIVDAIDRANPGWRNTYLLPTLTVAANQRLAEVRLLDLPSRILLRSQGRNPMDQPTVERNLNEALGTVGSSVADRTQPTPPPSAAPSAAAVPTATPASMSASTAGSTPTGAGGGDDLSNFFETK